METTDRAAELRADCGNCFSLCCVAPAFTASSDFAITKPAGQACPNLLADHRCGIHDRLQSRGFNGCVVFDCLGAGPKVSNVVFGGQDWRVSPELAPVMFDVFAVVRQLHEMLWYLGQAAAAAPSAHLRDEAHRLRTTTARLTLGPPAALRALDVEAHRAPVAAVLREVSAACRSSFRASRAAVPPGPDWIGRKLPGADLVAADLRGFYLIGADLRGADLRSTDLLGADLRGTDLRGADLSGALFLTPSQVTAARGDHTTRLPPDLSHPLHWHNDRVQH